MANEQKKVLICHSTNRQAEARALKERLELKGCAVRMMAIDSPECSQDSLNELIRWADRVIFLIDDELKKDKNSGIAGELAEQCAKPIIGVWGEGVTETSLPNFLDDHSDAICENDIELVIDAIDGGRGETHVPNGDVRPPRDLDRHTCS